MTIESDIQKADPGATVTLFEVDGTAQGGTVLYLHAGVNELKSDVVWDGDTYTRFPIDASGFAMSGAGTIPRPRLRVANITGLIGALTRDLNDLVGAKVTRRRTFVRYLDAVNFTGGSNPTADPTASFPDEIYFVGRKLQENKLFIDFELSSAFDVEGKLLPGRQVVANVCQWIYKSAECTYASGPVATIADVSTTSSALDDCGKRLTSCKFRHDKLRTGLPLPFGAFPGAGRVR